MLNNSNNCRVALEMMVILVQLVNQDQWDYQEKQLVIKINDS